MNQQAYGNPPFQTQGLFLKEDILAKAEELAELIGTSEEVQIFKKAEAKVNNHERIQSMIQQMKKKQKEIVAFESLKNAKMVAQIEGEIDELQSEIDAIPLVTEYQQSQSDINYMLQLVMSAIYDTVSTKINVESGSEAPPSRCD
ncbi:RicAFT regulatory complex protein RicA family protein [Paenibacillus sp. CAA11]|uniref:RicAFT regulatory complex protein RicA family protein n=1 Tax=Paenibacillus sp. CAA11 TaxID=1532905 RepID=UPI003FA3DB34